MLPLLLFFFQDPTAEGIQALEQRRYSAAVAAFEKAVAADGKDYSAHFHLALAQSLNGNLATAVTEYEKTLELKPGLYEAELNLGILLVDLKKPADAVAHLDRAVRQKPKEFRPVYSLAEALLAAGQLDRAESQFRDACEIDPKSGPAKAGLARTLLRAGKLKEAEPLLREAGDADGLLELASQFEKAKDLNAAMAIYQNFLGQPAVSERLGELLIEAGRPEDAIAPLESAVKQAPTAANRYALATAYLRAKRIEQAGVMMQQALAAEPRNVELRLAYAGLLRDEHKFQEAAREFHAVTQLKPDSREAWSGLATMLLSLENHPQAIAAFDRLEALGNPNPGIYFFRALANDRSKQLKPALADYQKFLEMSQNKNPDEEFKARQRIRVIQKELSKR